jgi:hypothetical protein
MHCLVIVSKFCVKTLKRVRQIVYVMLLCVKIIHTQLLPSHLKSLKILHCDGLSL